MAHELSPAEFARNTKEFRRLYDGITTTMTQFAAGLTDAERQWFQMLVDGFEARYQQWRTDVWLDPYLTHLDTLAKRRRRGLQLRLIGHAYLHIALDLPRVIGDSLERSDIPHSRASDIFRQPNDAFRDAFIETLLDAEYTGWRAHLLRFGVHASRRFASGLRLAADRVIAWRTEAWINGFALAEPRTRPTAEAVLRRTFGERCRVMHRSDDPVEWLAELTSPWALTESFDVPVATRFGRRPTSSGPSARPDDFLD